MLVAVGARGLPAVVVCSVPLRPALSRTVRQIAPGVTVVSYAEIGEHLDVNVVTNIDIPALSGNQREEQHDQFARSS